MRHMLNLKDWDGQELAQIIDKAIEIKNNKEKYYDILKNKALIMLFQKTSTRTRLSFETGMTQLGGHAVFLDWRTTQFGISDFEDEARALCRFGDIVMARLLKNETLNELAEVATIPIINGLCEKYHPCQALGDMMTIKEKLGKLEGVNLTYFGIGNNVSNSLTLATSKLGVNFTLCAPERHPPSTDEEILSNAKSSGKYKETNDPKEGMDGADAIYTDTWVDMEYITNPDFAEEKERRMKTFMPFQINKELYGDSNAIIMHDMPIHPGYEMAKDMIYNPNSAIFDQAENRMHIQKAIILKLLEKF